MSLRGAFIFAFAARRAADFSMIFSQASRADAASSDSHNTYAGSRRLMILIQPHHDYDFFAISAILRSAEASCFLSRYTPHSFSIENIEVIYRDTLLAGRIASLHTIAAE